MKIGTRYTEERNTNYTYAQGQRADQEMHDILPREDDENKSFKYELVGTMIKVMLVVNGVEVSCIKSIPVQNASPEIIAKIENLTFIDMVMINDLQKEDNQPKEDMNNLPKEHLAYEKHSIYE